MKVKYNFHAVCVSGTQKTKGELKFKGGIDCLSNKSVGFALLLTAIVCAEYVCIRTWCILLASS